MHEFDSIRKNKPAPPLLRVYDTSIQSKPQGQPTSINLMSRRPKEQKSRSPLRLVLVIVILLVVGLGGLVVARATDLSNKIFVGQKTTLFQKIKQAITGGSSAILEGEKQGQINVLLLGIGGEGHDGPYLTDTIILAQIRPESSELVLTSIPRDYLVELPDNKGGRKLNAAFAEGYYKNQDFDEAGRWARQQVEKISGLKIPYFAVIDFAGFAKAIDQIEGIDVEVERTFTDYSFPDDFVKDTKGYLAPLTFTQGMDHMNGERALQFARSRHAAGVEGSDFARSQRQQKVMSAFKQKIFDLNIISNAGTINKLLGTFADHFHTNIDPGELLHMYTLVKEKNIHQFLSLSLDPETKLICPKILEETGAYVLLPCEGKTTDDIQNYFKNAFTNGKLVQEQAVIWLANSGPSAAAYRTIDRKLKNTGLTVWELPYEGIQLDKTIVYQVNPKPATAEFLENEIGATEATLPPPGVKVDKSKVDVIVILGKDAEVTTEYQQ